MAKADHKFKLPKWLAVLLWVIVVFAAYVGISWWWHYTGKHADWAFSELDPADPFIDPRGTPSPLVTLGNHAFYDFPGWYRGMTYPLRDRKDPNGNPYFYEDQYGSAQLRAMKEPSLLKRRAGDESDYFRFTLIPLSDGSQTFRISINPNSTIELQATQLNGNGMSHPGEIQSQKTFTLKESEFDNLVAESRDSNFWQPVSDIEKFVFFDGPESEWIFERSTPTSYDAVAITYPRLKAEMTADTIQKINDLTEVREPYQYAKIGRRILEKFGFPRFTGEDFE